MPAAPAPATTTRVSSMRRFVSTSAFRNAAPLMIAVPCWSSWKTGMSISAISRSSISKHSGARMSSRLIPPKVGSSSFTVWITSSGSSVASSMSNTSMPAKRLNRTPLPSITGLPASAPDVAEPEHRGAVRDHRDQVPARGVQEGVVRAASGSRDRAPRPRACRPSRGRAAVCTLLVGTTWILPGRPFRWYSSACSLDGQLVLACAMGPPAWTVQADRPLGGGGRDYHREFGGLGRSRPGSSG